MDYSPEIIKGGNHCLSMVFVEHMSGSLLQLYERHFPFAANSSRCTRSCTYVFCQVFMSVMRSSTDTEDVL